MKVLPLRSKMLFAGLSLFSTVAFASGGYSEKYPVVCPLNFGDAHIEVQCAVAFDPNSLARGTFSGEILIEPDMKDFPQGKSDDLPAGREYGIERSYCGRLQYYGIQCAAASGKVKSRVTSIQLAGVRINPGESTTRPADEVRFSNQNGPWLQDDRRATYVVHVGDRQPPHLELPFLVPAETLPELNVKEPMTLQLSLEQNPFEACKSELQDVPGSLGPVVRKLGDSTVRALVALPKTDGGIGRVKCNIQVSR